MRVVPSISAPLAEPEMPESVNVKVALSFAARTPKGMNAAVMVRTITMARIFRITECCSVMYSSSLRGFAIVSDTEDSSSSLKYLKKMRKTMKYSEEG